MQHITHFPDLLSNICNLGFLLDQGRVLTTSGAWLRYRASLPAWDFIPFDSSSLVRIPGSVDGFAFAANSTSFTTLTTYQTAYFICERIGILYNILLKKH